MTVRHKYIEKSMLRIWWTYKRSTAMCRKEVFILTAWRHVFMGFLMFFVVVLPRRISKQNRQNIDICVKIMSIVICLYVQLFTISTCFFFIKILFHIPFDMIMVAYLLIVRPQTLNNFAGWMSSFLSAWEW